MKKMMGKIVAFLLMATIIFGGTAPVTALALEYGARIGKVAYVWSEDAPNNGDYYSNVTSAWNAAREKGNVMLLSDWKTSAVLTVPRSKTITVYMNGYSIDRGLTEAQRNGQVFSVSNRSNLIIYGTDSADEEASSDSARITGGYNSNGGGAIHVLSDAGVYLYGVSITGNKTTHSQGGGGILMYGNSSRLEMNEHTYVSSNEAIGTSGGGISFQGSGCIVSGGNLIGNKADMHGGAIASFSGGSVSSFVIMDNEAKGNGGAAYIDEDCGLSLSGCIIENNSCGGNGGAIYTEGGGSLSSGIVQNNLAGGLGGGVFVSPDCSFGISGSLIVKNNDDSVKSSIESDNIYLHFEDDEMGCISGYPTSGEVHIGWNSSLFESTSFKLSNSDGIYSTKFMVSDVEGYFFYWSWDTSDGKNDKYIWADTTDYNPHYSFTVDEVQVSDRYHVIENGYKGKYDLQEGLFGYQSTSDRNKATVYFYSDGYFADAPDIYNPSLATMSYALASAAANAGVTNFDEDMPSGAYSNLFRHAMMLMSDIGIEDKNIVVNDGFEIAPTQDTIGMIMGAKEIRVDDEEYVLIPIAIRGGGYGAEWASNVLLSNEGEAKGFSSAATQVIEQVESYIESNTSLKLESALKKGKVKFWVVGFSRGGAVANITAKRLTDAYGEAGNSVYGYTFEAAKGGTDAEEINEKWTYNGVYANVHNVINPSDPVPQIAPKQMGFKRYGVDHYLPGTDAGEIVTTTYTTPTGITVTTHADNTAYSMNDDAYIEKRTEMKEFLAAIDGDLIFYDYFSVACVNFLGILSGSDLISEIDEASHVTPHQWLDSFLTDLADWSANGSYANGSVNNNGGYNGDYRDFYTSNSEFAGQELMTIEDALNYLFNLLYTLENSDELTDILSLRIGSVMEEYTMLFDFYFNIVKKWDELSKEKQTELLDNIWSCLYTDMEYPGAVPVKKITDILDADEIATLKSAVYSLASFLFLFVSRDHNEQPSIEGVSTTQVHLGTLLYNSSVILQCHNPNVCMAWLNAYDDIYSDDSIDTKYTNSSVYLIPDGVTSAPTLNADVSVKLKSIAVTLFSTVKSNGGVDENSSNNGSAIYYAIYENGTMVGDWQLYKAPIVLDKSKDVEYSIKAFATRFAEKSEVLELSDDDIRNPSKPSIRQNHYWHWILISAVVIILVATAVVLIILKKKKAINKQ